jgi:hypothetical protein
MATVAFGEGRQPIQPSQPGLLWRSRLSAASYRSRRKTYNFLGNPTSALRRISLPLRRKISTYYDTRFMRLEFGELFTKLAVNRLFTIPSFLIYPPAFRTIDSEITIDIKPID